MPTSRLQTHCPDSVGARSSLPCALPDSNIKFYHSQEIQQTDKDVDYVSSEAELRCIGSGTHQLRDLGQVTGSLSFRLCTMTPIKALTLGLLQWVCLLTLPCGPMSSHQPPIKGQVQAFQWLISLAGKQVAKEGCN